MKKIFTCLLMPSNRGQNTINVLLLVIVFTHFILDRISRTCQVTVFEEAIASLHLSPLSHTQRPAAVTQTPLAKVLISANTGCGVKVSRLYCCKYNCVSSVNIDKISQAPLDVNRSQSLSFGHLHRINSYGFWCLQRKQVLCYVTDTYIH